MNKTTYIISIVLGLGLSRLILGSHRTQIHGPNSNKIRQYIYQKPPIDEFSLPTCYRYVPKPYICPLDTLRSK